MNSRGGRFLEASVCGSKEPARRGELIIVASGDEELFDDCYSCFEAMGKKSFYLGTISCVMSKLPETYLCLFYYRY